MSRNIMAGLLVVGLVAIVATPIAAQKAVKQGGTVSESATIEAIDHTTRMISLKDSKGEVADVYVGPEVKRFNELKVGDVVTFSYHESVVYQIRQPGQPAPSPSAAVTPSTGAKPGATIAQQHTASVTVTAIDVNVPSITVKTAEGHTISARVEDKKNLEGVKVGDKVDVTYTQAVMISVASPKK
ncbi:MAG TPA: hypothetical protein VH583_02355 [Vicinamibacterales bacterium]